MGAFETEIFWRNKAFGSGQLPWHNRKGKVYCTARAQTSCCWKDPSMGHEGSLSLSCWWEGWDTHTTIPGTDNTSSSLAGRGNVFSLPSTPKTPKKGKKKSPQLEDSCIFWLNFKSVRMEVSHEGFTCRKLTGGLTPAIWSQDPWALLWDPSWTWTELQSSISPGQGLLLLQWDNTAKVFRECYRVLVALDHHTHQRCSQHPPQLSKARAGLWSSPPHWHWVAANTDLNSYAATFSACRFYSSIWVTPEPGQPGYLITLISCSPRWKPHCAVLSEHNNKCIYLPVPWDGRTLQFSCSEEDKGTGRWSVNPTATQAVRVGKGAKPSTQWDPFPQTKPLSAKTHSLVFFREKAGSTALSLPVCRGSRKSSWVQGQHRKTQHAEHLSSVLQLCQLRAKLSFAAPSHRNSTPCPRDGGWCEIQHPLSTVVLETSGSQDKEEALAACAWEGRRALGLHMPRAGSWCWLAGADGKIVFCWGTHMTILAVGSLSTQLASPFGVKFSTSLGYTLGWLDLNF